MKVFENIDNYDFFPAYEMSEEDEERFIGDLRKIVTDLIPLRGNKRKTRQYFTKYLRLDYNIRQHEFRHTEYTLEGPVCEKYVPQPGEYDWESDKLQPALIEVLENDKHSFGHIVNLLNYDIADRRGLERWNWEPISDDAVKYTLKFDIEEIRAKVEGMPSFDDKLAYLNKVKRDVDLFGGLEQDDYDAFGQAFEYYLDKLTESVKEEQKIWKEKIATDSRYIFLGPTAEEQKKECIVSDEYKLDSQLFESRISHCLESIYFGEQADVDKNIYAEAVRAIQKEFNSFVAITFKSDRQDTSILLERVNNWNKLIRGAIENSYANCKECVVRFKQLSEGRVLDSLQRVPTLSVSKMLVEEANLVSSMYLSKVLFSNREGLDIMFDAWKGGVDALIERRQALLSDFGKVEERDACTKVNDNFSVFYHRMLEIAKDAIMECTHKSNEQDVSIKLAESSSKLNTWLFVMQENYMKLNDTHDDPIHYHYYEAVMWAVVAGACAQSVFLAIERLCAFDYTIRRVCASDDFQNLNFNIVPELVQRLIERYLCTEDDEDLRTFENDLSFVLLNKPSGEIPPFDENLIRSFIFEDYKWAYELHNTPESNELEEMAQNAMLAAEAARTASMKQQAEARGMEYVELEPGAHLIRRKNDAVDSSRPEGEIQNSITENSSTSSGPQVATQSLLLKFKDKIAYEPVIAYLKSKIGEGFSVKEMAYLEALYESDLTASFQPADVFQIFPHLSEHPQQYSKYVGETSEFNKKGKRGRENKHRKTIDNYIEELQKIAEESKKNSKSSVSKTVD